MLLENMFILPIENPNIDIDNSTGELVELCQVSVPIVSTDMKACSDIGLPIDSSVNVIGHTIKNTAKLCSDGIYADIIIYGNSDRYAWANSCAIFEGNKMVKLGSVQYAEVF